MILMLPRRSYHIIFEKSKISHESEVLEKWLRTHKMKFQSLLWERMTDACLYAEMNQNVIIAHL